MANPITPGNGASFRTPDIDTVALHLVVAFGGSGVPATATRSREFVAAAPITHTSTGLYRIFLRESWVALLNHNLKCDMATYSTSGACTVNNKQSATNVSINNAFIDVEFRTLAGALVDPASGDTFRATFELQKTKP